MNVFLVMSIVKKTNTNMAEGVFLTETEAIEHCLYDEFIVESKVGERFPENAVDAIKMYWPLQETWEESTLYKLRNKK